MSNPWTHLAADVAALGLALDADFESRVRVFLGELGRWGQVARLTGYRTKAERIEHLVLESLLLLAVLPESVSPLLDIGSGAGVPGLILKLARPAWAVTLVEANRRRANFLRHVSRRLGLEAVAVETTRAEALAGAPALRGRFRTVTLRAVASLPRALALARPFLAPEGRIVVSLGPGAAPALGTVREVSLPRPAGRLPLRRAFLIIGATEVPADVPRGTRGSGDPRSGGRQPKGRGGQDDDRREPRRRAGGRRAVDPPGRSGPPGQRHGGGVA